jgi:hypothetical protein
MATLYRLNIWFFLVGVQSALSKWWSDCGDFTLLVTSQPNVFHRGYSARIKSLKKP